MTGVDHAVAMGWADPDRLVCYGWSYGGYLSAWIVTRTGRFKAVSPGAGLTNLYSMYSTNDIQDYLASFFGGTPWTATDNYREHSPITYVADVTSPVLLMHGGSDTRVPPEQSVEFYRALRDLGKGRHLRPLPARGARHRRAASPGGSPAALRRVLRRARQQPANKRRPSRTEAEPAATEESEEQ